jgi:hypothetical protein
MVARLLKAALHLRWIWDGVRGVQLLRGPGLFQQALAIAVATPKR